MTQYLKRFCALGLMVFLSLFGVSLCAQTTDLEYLPDNQNYDPSIPLPSDILGYPVGTWHVRHDQLVHYMYALADASDRIAIEEIGRTHEHRPLLMLTVSMPDNLQKMASLKQAHIERITSGGSADKSDPLFIYMGYSVHGNEPSGSNAALLVAYHLAASNSPDVTKLLSENVVLLDPALNPDGLSRFAQWANMHKGKTLVSDPMHREHREYWPSGRTNHYWFDLNRDWLLLTHPESQARIKQFQAWRPHILTDFHEMGTNSTYFFQPGVPSRKNPLTPEQNVTLTGELAKFHANALDDDNQLYFTEERFDDFYYGKGSTYPDAHGSIGILFEQASSRGHLQESENGLLSFPRTIKNQITTSLSTFAGAMANKAAIHAYQRQFYNDTQKLIKDDDQKGFIVALPKDEARTQRMLDILSSHNIEYQLVTDDVEANDIEFKANQSLFVSLNQTQYRLIKSLFSDRQRFPDNTFYDVSNWNIALAFNMTYSPVSSSELRRMDLTDYPPKSPVKNSVTVGQVAYAFQWHSHNAPALLQDILENDIQVKVAGGEFTADTVKGKQAFDKGAVIIPSGLEQPKNFEATLEVLANEANIEVFNITSGLTSVGIDLGSGTFEIVEAPQVLIIGGVGTSSYEVGEIWHYLDTSIGLPASIWDMRNLESRSLDRYTHIIFASGRYNRLTKQVVNKISQWVKEGGVLIGQKTALRWFTKNDWLDNEVVSTDAINAAFSTEKLTFGDKQALAAKKLVAGAVYESVIDTSHPLFFGFQRGTLPLFKTNNLVLEASENPFEDIALYTKDPLMAGYSADEMQQLISNTAAIVVNPIGRGKVIGFVDNVHFRGYWEGTNKLTANAIYLSNLM